jgi:hypothetical protein
MAHQQPIDLLQYLQRFFRSNLRWTRGQLRFDFFEDPFLFPPTVIQIHQRHCRVQWGIQQTRQQSRGMDLPFLIGPFVGNDPNPNFALVLVGATTRIDLAENTAIRTPFFREEFRAFFHAQEQFEGSLRGEVPPVIAMKIPIS